MIYFVAVLCVLGIAGGQILFKLSAASLQRAGIFDPQTLITLFTAFALYGITTIAWVWVLQKIELGKAYPLMAMAFVLVPIGSHFVFGERFSVQYFVGVALIMSGIVVALKA
ncbi:MULTISPECIES: 4-amino-4-deoxy-L-arabinose-phospho-UDP flippase [Pseudomonas]|jgi:drug/metabolite transporter (DMT)-like permease|uniref:4-amino-4-deoxy-L-arabinose-phospho-UDP flippase n=1 Tax=Pseudomonas coleopterorum TaxID=1605838 RepID=A0AAJ6MVC4_9PSED|nr:MULTISPECIES: 4-amino-4-deoxy-L-arabinose-phospho-UDP flippase [Pseudomonas]MBD8684808.1 4-amino-4-deoxy-L-arabinose-phospho-UDP flippase [Pseudomonas sp. CFBP 13719]MBD8729757.1 4-amino-4-deoxy-L-arabinose-phospho-UDP flippase [Pseudomonas sp. CFBP 13710]WNC11774.1 4-amino-4-deoxy-L-arabinose-phospho-UDP flippase [Pseudomonas coleopterorum]